MTWIERYGLGLVLTAVVALLTLFWIRQLQLTDGQLGVPLDDAWIHYQFARNISQGNGFSYNPGQPTPGSTAPLWTVILAGVGLFTEAFIVPSILLSGLFLLLTIWLVYQLVCLLKLPDWVALLAALGSGLAGRLLWAGLSGMEVTLFCLLTLLTLVLYERDGFSWQTAVIVGLASQVRPEAHLLFVILIANTLYKQLKTRGNTQHATRNTLLLPIAIYIAINLPYALFSLSVTGRPLPNTFYAKSDSTQLYSWRTLRELIQIHFQDNGVLFALVPLGLWELWQRSRVTVLWLLGLFMVTPIVVPFLWHHGRYTMPLIPFMMMVGAIGCWWLVQKISQNRKRFGWITAVFLVIIAGAIRLPFWVDMLGNNSREIIEIDVAVGKWLAENSPKGALIAVDDIGAIGFLSDREIFDLNGLISPEVWPVMNDTEAGIPRDVAMARVLTDVQPDYLVIFPEWHWNLAINPQIVREVTQFTTGTHTIIGAPRVLVYEVVGWPLADTAVAQFPTDYLFGDAVELTGYDVVLGGQLDINLYWRSLAPLTESYDIFIHVTNDAEEIVTQADSVPVASLLPTTLWQVDDQIKDQYTLQLPPDLPSGAYEIRAGLFHRPTGVRLAATGDGLIKGDAAVLTTIFFNNPAE